MHNFSCISLAPDQRRLDARPGAVVIPEHQIVKEPVQSSFGASNESLEGWALLVGGGKRVRTADLLLAKQVLSQLSYAPARFSYR